MAPFDPDRDLVTPGPVVLRVTAGHATEAFPATVWRAVVPDLLEYIWGDDLLRWELAPDGTGSRLTLSHTVQRAEWVPRTAAGWPLYLVGIRSSIAPPQITGFTVANALAFDNPHVISEVTAAGLLAAMENAVSRIPASDGRFPQLAGAYLEYDPNRPGLSDRLILATPSRVKSLRVQRAAGGTDTVVENFALVGDPARRFTVAANEFLMSGGDGYQALKAASEAPGARKIALPEREQQTLIDYVDKILGLRVDRPDPVTRPRIVRASG